MSLENLRSYDESFDYEDDTMLFESDDEDNLIYDDGELYEAKFGKMTSKEKKIGHQIGQLMTALNKNTPYKMAKAQFIKSFKTEARKCVKDNNLRPTVLKKLDKITLRSL